MAFSLLSVWGSKCVLLAGGQGGTFIDLQPDSPEELADSIKRIPSLTNPKGIPEYDSLSPDVKSMIEEMWSKKTTRAFRYNDGWGPYNSGGFKNPTVGIPELPSTSGGIGGIDWAGGFTDPGSSSGGIFDPGGPMSSFGITNLFDYKVGSSIPGGNPSKKTAKVANEPTARPVVELPQAVVDLMLEEASARKNYATNYLNHLNSRLEYESEILDINLKTLRWTSTESKVGFWIAHACLLFGILLASSEYLNARRLRKMGRKADNPEIEIGAESLAFKNVSVAMLLVVLSFALYLAYLKFVFPIQSV